MYGPIEESPLNPCAIINVFDDLTFGACIVNTNLATEKMIRPKELLFFFPLIGYSVTYRKSSVTCRMIMCSLSHCILGVTCCRSPKMEYTSMTTVQEWLESIKMGQYHDKFNKAGFTHLNQVANNDELDLNEMGIKLIGHKNKIRKSIREVKKTLDKDSLQVV